MEKNKDQDQRNLYYILGNAFQEVRNFLVNPEDFKTPDHMRMFFTDIEDCTDGHFDDDLGDSPTEFESIVDNLEIVHSKLDDIHAHILNISNADLKRRCFSTYLALKSSLSFILFIEDEATPVLNTIAIACNDCRPMVLETAAILHAEHKFYGELNSHQATTQKPRWVSIERIREKLGVSTSTVHNWRRDWIPTEACSMKSGRWVLDLNQIVESMKKNAPDLRHRIEMLDRSTE